MSGCKRFLYHCVWDASLGLWPVVNKAQTTSSEALQLGSPVLSNKLTDHFKHVCGNSGANTRVNRSVTTLTSRSHSISCCPQWAHTRLGMSTVNHGGGRGRVAWLLPDELWANDRCSGGTISSCVPTDEPVMCRCTHCPTANP